MQKKKVVCNKLFSKSMYDWVNREADRCHNKLRKSFGMQSRHQGFILSNLVRHQCPKSPFTPI